MISLLYIFRKPMAKILNCFKLFAYKIYNCIYYFTGEFRSCRTCFSYNNTFISREKFIRPHIAFYGQASWTEITAIERIWKLIFTCFTGYLAK